jgi:hypothetical protein
MRIRQVTETGLEAFINDNVENEEEIEELVKTRRELGLMDSLHAKQKSYSKLETLYINDEVLNRQAPQSGIKGTESGLRSQKLLQAKLNYQYNRSASGLNVSASPKERNSPNGLDHPSGAIQLQMGHTNLYFLKVSLLDREFSFKPQAD